MTMTKMQAAASAYLRRGWSVIPIQPKSKLPATSWAPFQQRLPTEQELAGWFDRWPDMNIGIVTGAVSGLVVLDVDPRHGGEASLRQLEEAYGRLAETIEAETGGGGRHLYLQMPPRLLRNKAGLAAGVDVRADGGIVVAPPSVH
ncbi:MAG TPA: bifunctional DNA primase/polymerase, partial [Candidatus Udaeobacter sp.]|nr:bifunctional DNA primase/polymerase [Candidatus Udaeobacter sp.]